jgi:hypothetical protein
MNDSASEAINIRRRYFGISCGHPCAIPCHIACFSGLPRLVLPVQRIDLGASSNSLPQDNKDSH